MIKEPWDYDYHSHKVILNVGTDRSYRRNGKVKSVNTNILNRPRLVVLGIVITILLSLFLKEARTVLASNPQFVINDIIIENTDLIKRDALEEILKLKNNNYLFNISTARIARILEEDPDIESAVVEKILPGTLKIVINERLPYARLDMGGKEYYIDYNGILLWREREASSLPKISGLKVEKLVPGEPCMASKLDVVLNILRTGDSLGWDKFIEPVEVRVTNEDYISIHTRERISIKLKIDDIQERLNKLMFVLNDVQNRGRLIKTVDLRFRDVYVE